MSCLCQASLHGAAGCPRERTDERIACRPCIAAHPTLIGAEVIALSLLAEQESSRDGSSTDGPEGDAMFEAARLLMRKLGQDQMIVVSWNAGTGQTRVTTVGVSLDDAVAAARGGELIARALGWPEEYRGKLPARAIAASRVLCERCDEGSDA